MVLTKAPPHTGPEYDCGGDQHQRCVIGKLVKVYCAILEYVGLEEMTIKIDKVVVLKNTGADF